MCVCAFLCVCAYPGMCIFVCVCISVYVLVHKQAACTNIYMYLYICFSIFDLECTRVKLGVRVGVVYIGVAACTDKMRWRADRRSNCASHEGTSSNESQPTSHRGHQTAPGLPLAPRCSESAGCVCMCDVCVARAIHVVWCVSLIMCFFNHVSL